jgi:chemotaxis protein methyltransferase CheR
VPPTTTPRGEFDLVLCRYVASFLSDHARRDLFNRLAHALAPGGVLVLGGAESPRGYSDAFERQEYGTGCCFLPS